MITQLTALLSDGDNTTLQLGLDLGELLPCLGLLMTQGIKHGACIIHSLFGNHAPPMQSRRLGVLATATDRTRLIELQFGCQQSRLITVPIKFKPLEYPLLLHQRGAALLQSSLSTQLLIQPLMLLEFECIQACTLPAQTCQLLLLSLQSW